MKEYDSKCWVFTDRSQLEKISKKRLENIGGIYRLLDTIWLAIDPEDESFGKVVCRDGFWEAWITHWMIKQLPSYDVFVDVGANFGYYSVLASKHGIPSIAIEPQEYFEEYIRLSELSNGVEIALVKAALSDNGETVCTLSKPEDGKRGGVYVEKEGEGTIPVVRMDQIISLPSNYNALVKIDAEGYEPKIWDGMEEILNTCKVTTFLEWDAARYDDPDAFANELLGYKVTQITYSGNEAPITKERMLAQRDDWITLVVRN